MTSQIRRKPSRRKRDSRATKTKSTQRADKFAYCSISPLDAVVPKNCPFCYRLMDHWFASLHHADNHIMMLLSGNVCNRVVHLIKWLALVAGGVMKARVELPNGRTMASSRLVAASPKAAISQSGFCEVRNYG